MAAAAPDQHRAMLACCRPDAQPQGDRRMRQAIARMETDPALKDAFAQQAEFDDRMAALVRGLPLPESFVTEIDAGLREAAPSESIPRWRRMLREPVLWAVMLAVGVMLYYAGEAVYDHINGFAGDDTVRQIIETARTGPHADHLEPLDIECSQLGDKLFIQYSLEDYEVPAALAHDRTAGYRVFAKNDSLVAQVIADHHGQGMVFLMFRADQQGVNIHPPGHWKFLRGDHWTAAVMVRHHVGFVAVTPSKGEELRAYLEKWEAEHRKPDSHRATSAQPPKEKRTDVPFPLPVSTPSPPPNGVNL